MKCPKCEVDMEKAAKTDTMICRQCGHSESSLTKAELVAKVTALEKWKEELEAKNKPKEEDKERW